MTLASPSIHTSLHMFCWEERRIKEEDGLREGFDCKAASQQTSLSLFRNGFVLGLLKGKTTKGGREAKRRGGTKDRSRAGLSWAHAFRLCFGFYFRFQLLMA